MLEASRNKIAVIFIRGFIFSTRIPKFGVSLHRIANIHNYCATAEIMNKKILSILLCTVLASCTAAYGRNNFPGIPYKTAGELAHNVIWAQKLYRQIEFLADSLCAGRASGTVGNTEAASWIARRFSQIGLMKFGDSYSSHFTEPNGCNIIGMLPGSPNIANKPYIIVGAHYDGLGVLRGTLFPGADSNASGVVAMLSIAELFKAMNKYGQTYGKNILFVGFDAKASSMRGSRDLWEKISRGELKDPVNGTIISPDKISMMVNIDQIGGTAGILKSGRGDFIIMLGKENVGRKYSDLLGYCNFEYGSFLELSFDYFGSRDFTRIFLTKVCDQKVFVENNIPAVLFTSGITMNNNKPYDNVQSLDMGIMKRRILLIFHWIDELMRMKK